MKVLLPLDGSEHAEMVFQCARELIGTMSLELILLYVGSSKEDELVIREHKAYIEKEVNKLDQEAKEIAQRYGGDRKISEISVRGEVIRGYPAEEIIRYADSENVDLILMASHGRSGLKRWRMGSVADKVLRASDLPVWLVRADLSEETARDELSGRHLVVPLDGSKLAESVLPYIKIAAIHRGSDIISITLLMVCEPPLITFSYSGPGIPVDPKEVERRELEYCLKNAEKYLDSVKYRLAKSGVSVERKVLVGNPTTEIIEYSKTNPANLIVIATHGHTGIRKMAYGSFGSVAQRILQEATNPTLVVRPRAN